MVAEHCGYRLIVIIITPLNLLLTAKQTLTPGLYDEYLPLILCSVGWQLLVPAHTCWEQVNVLYYSDIQK